MNHTYLQIGHVGTIWYNAEWSFSWAGSTASDSTIAVQFCPQGRKSHGGPLLSSDQARGWQGCFACDAGCVLVACGQLKTVLNGWKHHETSDLPNDWCIMSIHELPIIKLHLRNLCFAGQQSSEAVCLWCRPDLSGWECHLIIWNKKQTLHWL